MMSILAGLRNTFSRVAFGKLRNWCDYASFRIFWLIWLIWMEAYICRGRFIVNLKYDWLVTMSLGGAVVSYYMYHVKDETQCSDL